MRMKAVKTERKTRDEECKTERTGDRIRLAERRIGAKFAV